MIKTITAAELINGRTFDRTIIDIRPAEEYNVHVDGVGVADGL